MTFTVLIEGHLWFGTRDAIIKYDGQTFKNFSKKTGMGIVNVFSIIEDNRGYMWFGTELGGVKRWDGKTVKNFTKENGLSHNFVNTLLQDTQGNIWAGTEKGLNRYNGTDFIPVSIPGGLNTRSIMCMKEDSKKNVWIGTFGGGIARFMPDKNGNPAPGSFTAFTTEDGLLDDEILSMVFDNDGNPWIASKRGISVLDAAEFYQTGRKKFKYYDKDDGFIGIEPNDNAVYKDKNGNIWFGTLNGAIKFNPKKDKPNTVKPTIFITGLKLFLEEVNWSTRSKNQLNEFGLPKGLELSHLRNHLTFEFVGICLTVPEKVRYRVKLEGFDEHWSPVSKATYATYSNLLPGEYAFKVQACNNEGLWNKEPAVYQFRITPPYWQTWWFYLMVFIAGSGILYGFIRLRIQTLKKQKRVLEEQVRSRTLELEEEKAKVEQINRELEQRVEERTQKLAIANEKLLHAQKMEAIGTLAGGIAHDLNNILAGIVTYPDLLLMEMPEDSPLKSHVLAIQQSGEKAAAITRDLLSLAKRGAKMIKVVNLNRVISDFTQSPELKKIMTENPNVQMETHLKKELPNIMGSPVHLSKALMNLVSNAVEAMPHGGKIDIKTKNQYIDPHRDTGVSREVKEGPYAIVIVSDTGIGMSEQEVKRIFEPFYSKKNGGGTGLGLAVVWGTMQDHKGFITVQSHQGRGTSFTLYFPTTHQKLVEEETALAIDELMGNGESILVVDDIEQQREVASLILRKLGYSVNAVASGEEAIEYLKEHPVDLLMLDMILEQGISGLETYKRVLQMYPDQRAILVSGYSETGEVKEALRLGAGCYVKKPYHIEKIGKVVKEELNKQ